MTDAPIRASGPGQPGPKATQPISGTVTADQGAAGAQAWPISAASLPLPTGASTSAKQDALKAVVDLLATQATAAAIQAILTDGTQRSKLTDGASDVAVDPTGPALYVRLNRWGAANVGSAVTPADALTNAVVSPRVQSLSSVFNGTTWDRMRGDTTNGLDVDVTRSALPTGAATSAKQDDALAMKAKPAVADILSASRTTTGTLITVPANKVWKGWVQIAGSLAAAGAVNPRVSWAPGTGGTAAYDVAALTLNVIAAPVGTPQPNAESAISVHVILYAGTTSGTLTLTATGSQTFASVSGFVVDA